MNKDSLGDELWKSLHDATLLSLGLSWEDGVVTIVLRKHPEGRVAISGRGAVRVLCPREQPWGRSVSVNAVRCTSATQGGLDHLEIEMQSGDLIQIDAVSFSIEHLSK